MQNRKFYTLTAILLGILFIGFAQTAQAQKTANTMKIKLFFPKDDTNGEIEFVAVEREVKKTSAVADIAIRELLKGVNEAEKKLNLISTYEVKDIVNGREECASDKTKPLAAYFIGVKIKKGIAIVNFRSGGACYLDTAITAADYVMKPIEATLKQFPSIKGVNYAINGKVITEWDA